MRIAVGALLFEGNTFSPVVTRRAAFEANYCAAGAEVLSLAGTGTEIGGALAAAKARAIDVAPLIATHGGAGGRVAREVHDGFVADLLARLEAALPVDGVYLALHGAFVAEGIDDVEGALLEAVRARIGRTPVVVSCDLHAHVTPAMLANCQALIGYEHYPHDDTFETGERAVGLLADIVDGRLRPVMRAVRAPMILPAQRQNTKGEGPMVELRALAASRVRGRLRALSHFAVQPWLDFPELGFTAVAVADADAGLAEAAATELVDAAWERRGRFIFATHAPADAIREGLARPGFVVLVDSSDCVGGGASGDSAAALAALLAHAPAARASIHLADPESAAAARAAGVGARRRFALGNRGDPAYGAPIAVEGEVIALCDGRFTYGGGLMRGVTADMGPSAVIRVGAVDVLVSSRAVYEYGDEALRAAGIDPRAGKFVVVKNPMNHRNAYPDAGPAIVLDTPGPTTPNLAGLEFRRLARPFFPRDDGFRVEFTAFGGSAR